MRQLEKIRNKVQSRAVALPLFALAWNEIVYYSGRLLARRRYHYQMALSLDTKIPMISWTILIYFSCFLIWAIVYVSMAKLEREAAYRFFLADFLGKGICLVWFVLFPTTFSRPEVLGTGFWDQIMRLLYRIDEPNNLFPSIHCMVSWFCWIGVRGVNKFSRWWRFLVLLFAVAVCVATLTTKQHVIADVVGGILFAELSYIIAGYVTRRMADGDADKNK